jgi:hypothetical protein
MTGAPFCTPKSENKVWNFNYNEFHNCDNRESGTTGHNNKSMTYGFMRQHCGRYADAML